MVFAQTDSGTFITYIANNKYAVENYEIKKVSDDSRLIISRVAAQTNNTFTLELSRNQPLTFMIETNGEKVLISQFTVGEIKTSGLSLAERSLKINVDVVLENIVWAHYKPLVSKYDIQKGGVQNFTAFLPSQILAFETLLEKTGTVSHKIGNKTFKLNEFRLKATETNLIVDFLADEDGDPVFFSIPSQQVVVVRSGFEDLRKSKIAEKAELKNFSGKFTEEEVSFQNADVKLFGTLTLPDNRSKKHPAVVIITGSGPQDRNGKTILDIYRKIAERLSQAGVAVLRVDDRGAGKSLAPSGRATSYRDLINDSLTAFNYLAARDDINKIALLGHSEGSETALTIALEDKRVAALILLAGSSDPVNKIVSEQEIYQRAKQETINPADKTKVNPISKALAKQFEAAKKPENKNNLKLAWYRQHLDSNPALLAQKVKQPVLILQGERDSKVLAYHSLRLSEALIKGGNNEVSLRIFPDLTHLFTTVGDVAPSINEVFLKTLQNWAFGNLVDK